MDNKLTRFVNRHRIATRRWVWQRFNDQSPNAEPLFILGAQRSGTTILIKSLNENPRFEVFGEKSAAMENDRLKDTTIIRDMIRTCRSRTIVFKPLTESHRAHELLSLSKNARIIWAFRRAADRANSAVARFGSTNLEHLAAFVEGKWLDTWQAQGMSEDSLAMLKSFDFAEVSPHTAAGLFWHIRNALYFEQGLDTEPRVLPLAYEDLVSDPERVMRGICTWTNTEYAPIMIDKIHSRSVGRSESKLASDVEDLCQSMYERLCAVQERRWRAIE